MWKMGVGETIRLSQKNWADTQLNPVDLQVQAELGDLAGYAN